ncbi:MAG TPA: carbohydrate porin [Candidatus Baltobacteraceae bacterium]|nr:carbohydrate porin [Candidatus Baltobacteraceae bacterium]
MTKLIGIGIIALAVRAAAQDSASPGAGTNAPSLGPTNPPAAKQQLWNLHMQATYVGDWHPSFPAQYSGPESLDNHSQTAETFSADLDLGARLWHGAEFHVDGLFWQGFGFNQTLGVEAFPSAQAYKVGSFHGNVAPVRVFLRQTIGLGGDEEPVADDALHLGGQQDVSRITLTVGEISVLDIFDQNTYAGDATTQFLNWALVANEAWDYPANSLGYITGFAAELNQPQWTARYGFFQIPRVQNGMAIDEDYLQAWGMVTELERRFAFHDHPGAVRLLAYLNRADMGSYAEAVDNPARPVDIVDTRRYRLKYGFCLNTEDELFKGIGVFTRLGWNDGQSENWSYADVQMSVSAGLSIKGDFWHRPNDTAGLAGIVNAISRAQQQFFADGGLGILAGDGALNYGLEQSLETYYRFQVWKNISATADYQYVINPAYNKDRGPVSVVSMRLHWEF